MATVHVQYLQLDLEQHKCLNVTRTIGMRLSSRSTCGDAPWLDATSPTLYWHGQLLVSSAMWASSYATFAIAACFSAMSVYAIQ